MKQSVLVSACLLGVNCRYDGGSMRLKEVEELMNCANIIPICPEQLGGLPTPRTPAERRGERVVTRDGVDVTYAYERGAQTALDLAQLFGASFALLKERSPSCGSGMIYDGSFSGARVPGYGVTASKLKACGVQVFGESRAHELIEILKGDTK